MENPSELTLEYTVALLGNGEQVNSTALVVDPGASSQVEISWTPSEPGSYELRVEVRQDGTLVKVQTYLVEVVAPPKPDLSVLNLTVYGVPEPGGSVEVAVTVVNIGDAESPPTEIVVTEFPTGRVVYFGEIGPIPPGGEQVLSFGYTVPEEAGNYTLVVDLDPNNEVEEKDEANRFEFGISVPPPTEVPPTESPSPPPPTETEAPTQPPTSPTAPPETEYAPPPPVEEGGIPTAVLVAGAAIAGAIASYLFWRFFYPPVGEEEVAGRCCCLDWNVRPEGTILRTVKPVSRDMRAMEGKYKGVVVGVTALFAPIGGYLPLVAKGVNVDWIDARGILKGCDGGSGRTTSTLSIPVPENLAFKWEIVSGPGYLLSTPPHSHPHSSVAEGPAAIYVAPPLVEEDPNEHPRKRIARREVLVRLTVDDPEGQLKGLDSPIEERYFRIILVGQGLELLDPLRGRPLRESELDGWADYSEVRDAISLEEFEWIRSGWTPEPSSEELKGIKAQLEKVRTRRRAEEETLKYNMGILQGKQRALEGAARELGEIESELDDVERQLKNRREAWRRAREEARRRIESKYMPQIEQLRQQRRDLWKSHFEEVRRAREEGKSDEYILDLNRRVGERSSEIGREIARLQQEMWREINEAMKEIGLPSQPGTGLEEHLRYLERRREELRKALEAKRAEIEPLRRDVEDLERALDDLRKKIEKLRSEEERWRSALQPAIERAEAERECRPMFKWEDAKPIEGEILAPIRLYDSDASDSESPTPEKSKVDVRPREILILRARAEDVDRLRLWIKDGQTVEIEAKDWVRYEWSSRWADGREHGVEPGRFLVTREGETVIFLAPEEEGEIEVTCRMYDSGIQHPDGELRRSMTLSVRGSDPLKSIRVWLDELERVVYRPSDEEWQSDYERKPSERLGDLEKYILIDVRTTKYCLKSVVNECEYNLEVLWWSDLLWNIGNALLAVASIGSAISTTLNAIKGVSEIPKVRDVIFNWISTAAGAASTATAFVSYRWDLSTLEGKVSREAASAYGKWLKSLDEKANLRGVVGPTEGALVVSYEPRIRSLEREVYENVRVAKETAQSVWNNYVDVTLKITKRMNDSLKKASDVEASCILVHHFVQNLVFLLSLIRPPEEILQDIRDLVRRVEWDSLKAALSPLASVVSPESRRVTISDLIDALQEIQRIYEEELTYQREIFDGLKSLGVR